MIAGKSTAKRMKICAVPQHVEALVVERDNGRADDAKNDPTGVDTALLGHAEDLRRQRGCVQFATV